MQGPRLGRRVWLAGALASLGGAAPPPGAAIPLGVDDGRAVVPVLLNGGLAHMLLDTGAERSVISRAAAARLGLPFDPWVETTMRGAGGELETHRNADVQIATLGGVRLVQRATQPGLSLAVASFGLGGADGLLGGDILRHFTLDLDFPAGRMALRPARWAPPVGNSVPLTLLWPDLLLAPVRLDGQMLTALVDTGASASLVNARGLNRLGLTPASMARDQSAATAAIGGRLPVRVHRFSELRLGGLRIPAPWMLTAPVPEPAFDLILGLDILARQRIALSYASPRLTFPDQ